MDPTVERIAWHSRGSALSTSPLSKFTRGPGASAPLYAIDRPPVGASVRPPTVMYLLQQTPLLQETHTEKVVLKVAKTYDYCVLLQQTLK